MSVSFLPKNAFPLPAPLTSTLITLGLDDKAAATVSKVYLSSALTLKETCEREYNDACKALLIASDSRGYSSKELRARLLTASVTRYSQALSDWVQEITQKAKASVLKKRGKSTIQHKTRSTIHLPSRPGPKRCPELQVEKKGAKVEPVPFCAVSPQHAFPHAYPPPVRPEPISFVTHMSLSQRTSGYELRTVSDDDLEACVEKFSQLSLDPSSPQKSHTSSRLAPESRPGTRATSATKPTTRLSPSRPRPVSPKLDTSIAVSHDPLPKNSPSYSFPTTVPRTRNIDIPHSSRRKVCSIPYRRPTTHQFTRQPPSSISRTIRRTPSLVSDHGSGSEASSPSTPPDFPSMPIPTPTTPRKGTSPEAVSLLDQFLVPQSDWPDIDFGLDLYG